MFGLVGGRIVGAILGDAYGGEVGRELGHLVVYLALWMLAWVGFAVTFPLVFVAEKRWTLIPLAVAGFVLCIPVGLGLRSLWGQPGLAIALGVVDLVDHGRPDGDDRAANARRSPRSGFARLALAVGASATVAFGGLSIWLILFPPRSAVSSSTAL